MDASGRSRQALEKTYIKSTGYSAIGIGSHVAAVDVKDGKIVRIRPLPYDWKYRPEEFRPWKIEARGKTYRRPLEDDHQSLRAGLQEEHLLAQPHPLPLKRVDWDPDGEREPAEPGQERLRAGSPGTRLWTSSPASYAGSSTSTGPRPSSPRATATARPRWCTGRTAATSSCWTCWAAAPCRCATPIAGRAGTGAPSTSGAASPSG